jgi:hypothetical protein
VIRVADEKGLTAAQIRRNSDRVDYLDLNIRIELSLSLCRFVCVPFVRLGFWLPNFDTKMSKFFGQFMYSVM